MFNSPCKISELDVLNASYSRIIITPEIAAEYHQEIPKWIEVIAVKNKSLQLILQDSLDLGEATALTLAFEIPEATVILDDLKARKIAIKLGINITGTIGVIVKAKLRGTILSAKKILLKILATDFRISDNTIEEAIKQAGESP